MSDERPKAGQATLGHREIRCIRPKKPETPDFAQKTRAQYSFFSSLLAACRTRGFQLTGGTDRSVASC